VNKKIVVSDLQQQTWKGRFRKVGKEVIRIRMLNEGKRVRQEAARMCTKDKAIAAIRISGVHFPVCLLLKIVAPTFSKPHAAFSNSLVQDAYDTGKELKAAGVQTAFWPFSELRLDDFFKGACSYGQRVMVSRFVSSTFPSATSE
jgi:hypothetical protein